MPLIPIPIQFNVISMPMSTFYFYSVCLIKLSHSPSLTKNQNFIAFRMSRPCRNVIIANNNLFYRPHATDFMSKFVCILDLRNSWFAVYWGLRINCLCPFSSKAFMYGTKRDRMVRVGLSNTKCTVAATLSFSVWLVNGNLISR